jgi:hypothetical protein
MSKGTFWTPKKVGETIQGKYLMLSENQNGLVLQLKDQPAVGMNTVLVNLFGQKLIGLRIGDKIKIVFTGLTKKKGKRQPARLFDVWLNGKQLESKFSGKQIDKKLLLSKYLSK